MARKNRSTTSRRRGRRKKVIDADTRKEILRLNQLGYGTREIPPRVPLSRKLVRRVLKEEGRLPPADVRPTSKLEPFAEQIAQKAQQRLSTTRILREIQALGYTGKRTILAERVHSLKATLALETSRNKVKRRFETGPGEEMQIDWSPYLLLIAGVLTKVFALGCLLCHSRKLFLAFFRDERQATLLEGLAAAFQYFDGVAHRLVLDNMATAVLGRLGPSRTPLWHPRFLAFAQHYGFKPFACRPRDPDRKGKKEKSFRYSWEDFLKAAEFASWEDLNRRGRMWLDETPDVANLRIHGTTGLVPNQVYERERPLLIRLPEHRIAVHQDVVVSVDQDATMSLDGTRYVIPSPLANRSVLVRRFAHHFEVLGPEGQVVFSRRHVDPDQKGKLQIDQTLYAAVPRGRYPPGDRLDEAFVKRFPDLGPLVDGIKRRMKTLAPIHVRALLRLSDRFGQDAFLAAARRAQDFHRFDAGAIARILERAHPDLAGPDPESTALHGLGPALLGDVEPASLSGFDHLDRSAPSTPDPEDPDGT